MPPPSPHWRAVLHPFDGVLARLPASVNAVRTLMVRGHLSAAEAAARELLNAQPENLAALECFAGLLRRLGRHAEAQVLFRRAAQVRLRALNLPPAEEEQAVEFLLASEGAGPDAGAAPAGYLAKLFDWYAVEFDRHLVGQLHYRGAEALLDSLRLIFPAEPSGLGVLDCGCGTGLMGAVLRPWAGELHGFDLSPGMIERAREKGLYDELWVGKLPEALADFEARYDLIVAMEVFPYIGELAAVFAATYRALKPGGHFIFSTEALEGTGYRLQACGRYAHARDSLCKDGEAAGFDVVSATAVDLRFHQAEPVRSNVCVFRRTAGS